MRSLLSLSLLLLLSTDSQSQIAPTTTIHVDTKLTVVDLTVTDQYDRPVHGLKQSDFVIDEDGKPQPIRNFDEYGPTPTPARPVPDIPPGVYTNDRAAAPATGSVNIILFSQLGAQTDMIYARAQALDYLKVLPQGTRVAILLLENGVRVIQDITTDRDVLVAAVHAIEYHPVEGASFTNVRSLYANCIVGNEQSRLTVNALRQVAARFASIPGRKNLVWFTHGLPWLTNIAYYRLVLKVPCLDDDMQQLQEAYSMISASHVAISTVDPRGLEGDLTQTGMPGFVDRQLNQESIRSFAESTGGTAYYNRNDLDAVIAESVASNSDYYSIAYTPPLAGYDGKYHTISVKVNRPDLQLSYRKGYTSLDLAKLNSTIERDKNTNDGNGSTQAALPPAIRQFRAQMSHGAIPTTELLLTVYITPLATPTKPASLPVKGDLNPKIKPGLLVRYNVVYALSPGEITLAENPDGTRRASVEFDVVAYGEDGTKLNVLRQTANVTLKPEDVADFQQRSFKAPLQFDLPPGNLFVRVGALDILSGKSGTLEVSQTVAKP